jgi:hypothetical protein
MEVGRGKGKSGVIPGQLNDFLNAVRASETITLSAAYCCVLRKLLVINGQWHQGFELDGYFALKMSGKVTVPRGTGMKEYRTHLFLLRCNML